MTAHRFTIDPAGTDPGNAASRAALRAYAAAIRPHDPGFARELTGWADTEQSNAGVVDVDPIAAFHRALHGCERYALRIVGHDAGHALDRANANGIVRIVRETLDGGGGSPAVAAAPLPRADAASTPPVDRTACEMLDGGPVTDGHDEIDPDTGQQKGYVVLSAAERVKGFVRPLRRTYRHVGPSGPRNALRELTTEENDRHAGRHYVAYEKYPDSDDPIVGRYWTQADLDAAHAGCGGVTTIAARIAETYARDPKFYAATFCSHCRKDLPVDHFVWEGSDDRVGS